jgi:ArsR family transcriptional regulator
MQPTQIFKCLSDETRLKCLLLLVDRSSLCVCELQEVLNLSQPKVSRHLAELRNCGLVVDERRGRWMHYRLHPALPAWVLKTLRSVKAEHRQYIETYESRINELLACEA